MKWTNEDLMLLSSSRALKYLLEAEKPDFTGTLKRLKFEQELNKLQAELIKLQQWVVEQKERLVLIFEGHEFAGKGGTIDSFIEHLSPRSIRVIALPKPSADEAGQWYFQRYIKQLPRKGEIVLFDRSWYNRAMVEPVNGFCTQEEYKIFMEEVIHVERMLSNNGLKIVKFFLSIDKEEQKRRIEAVRKNPLRRWELTSVDENAQALWDTFNRYKDTTLTLTDTPHAPWTEIDSNHKPAAYLQAIKHVLSIFPYKS
jgi:polyphosphate kinase 2